MPKSENKAILEDMKKFFKVDSVEDVAEKLGYKRTTATTWRSKGVSNNAITRYKNLIYESNSTPTPSQTSLTQSLSNSYDSIKADEALLTNFKLLSDKDRERILDEIISLASKRLKEVYKK